MYALVDELGLKTFPTWNDAGKLLARSRREAVAPRQQEGRHAEAQPHCPRRPRAGPDPLGAARAQRRSGQAMGTPQGGVPRWPDVGDVDPPQSAHVAPAAATSVPSPRRSSPPTPATSPSSMRSSTRSSNADLETLASTDDGAQRDRVVGGSVLVSQRLAAGLDVRLGEPVVTVAQDDAGATVTTRSGRTYRAQAGGDRRAADAGRPPAVRPRAAGMARSAHAEDARRHRHQDLRRIPDPVLARRRPQRPSRSPTAARSR